MDIPPPLYQNIWQIQIINNHLIDIYIKMGYEYVVDVPRDKEKKIKDNYISTTKYNVFTFLPLALILQFKRYANIYFLICAILQSIKLISPLSPASAVAPLVFVLSLSMLREGFEDYKRWRSDESDNSQKTTIYDNKNFVQSEWKLIKAAQIIRINKDEIFPADFLVLVCSNASGISYVETSSLDGQKNLKPKFSQAQLQNIYNAHSTMLDFTHLTGKVEAILPSAQIQAFQGHISLHYGQTKLNTKINKKQMMLRGCKLKNTDWVIGLVIYTGLDTAIMRNGSEPFTKISNIERKVNNYILCILAFEIICCLISAGYCYYECIKQLTFESFLQRSVTNYSCLQLAGISFGSYFILYSTFIPISLIVSLEFVKVFQGYFMSRDKEMFCAINQKALQCRTVSINQQLGQIQYILTDKTGTLTCNKMQFRNIVIGNDMYGDDLNLGPIQDNSINYQRLSSRYTSGPIPVYMERFNAKSLSYDLNDQEQSQSEKNNKKGLIELIFMMITTCHECVPTSKGGYQGPSPDEVSLLNAAHKIGFKFISCENKIIKVQYNNMIKVFQLVKLVEFDSDRKKMTVVLRTQSGYYVFTKGADTNIEKILAPNQPYLTGIKVKTNEMSKTGLRSLWFAYKTLPLNIDIERMRVQDFESELTLVGATGIQDKLQDYVAETIFSLRKGGIKFIMLTGDKLQTAENIALSCKLIEEGTLINNSNDLRSFQKYINMLIQANPHEEIYRSPVIDGSSLNFIENEAILSYIINKVKSVVFCRVTPGQKAQIVRFVKNIGKLTLAIGDGANDVNMIMQAHVGVGIFGEEGMRAAQVANYAIGQFCLLWKLLLFYGRLNYMRITEMILYFFYKNMVFTSVQFVYAFYTLGSGQSFWLSWSITFYNMIFTFWPVVLRAIFEIDIELKPTKQTFHQLSQGMHEKQILYSYYPKMYHISQKNQLFTHLTFLAWYVLGICQGVICLILTLYAIGSSDDSSGLNSHQIGFYLVQVSAYTSVIIVVTIKLAVNVKHWTVLLVIGFTIPSLGAYIGYTFIVNVFQAAVSYETMLELLSMPLFYIIQFMCIGGMFSIDFLLFSLKSSKDSFENYLKFKTLKDQRLSESNLKQFMLEMTESVNSNGFNNEQA